MPKKLPRLRINLDLLKPQSQPQQIAVRLIGWLLSSGRFLVIIVEIVVLAAFLMRFKLDDDISSTRQQIKDQIPFIENSIEQEKLIRQTQFQLTTIKDKQDSADFALILKKLSDQMPSGVILKNLDMANTPGQTDLKMTATAADNVQLASFIAALKSSGSFSSVNLGDVSLEGGIINFSVSASITSNSSQERKL